MVAGRAAHGRRSATHVTGLGSWVADRVRVVETLAEAEPGRRGHRRPSRSPAPPTRPAPTWTGSAKYLADGGGADASAAAARAGPGPAGAAAELDRQGALFGVGADLVLRNTPPVRVHRLRFTPADAAVGGHGWPRRTGRPASR